MAKGRSYGERSFHPSEEFGGGSVFRREPGGVADRYTGPRLDEQRREILRSRPRAAFGESKTPKQQNIADAMADVALAGMVGVMFMDDDTERRLSRPRARDGAEAPKPNVSSARRGPTGPFGKEGPYGAKVYADVKQPSPQAASVNWRERAARAAASMDRASPGKPFFDEGAAVAPNFSKGSRGNVSPVPKYDFVSRGSQVHEVHKEARSASPQPKKSSAESFLTSTELRPSSTSRVVEEDCVERPVGDPHGPGKWRGQWFNWCKD